MKTHLPPVTRFLLISNVCIFFAISLLGYWGHFLLATCALHPLFAFQDTLHPNPFFMPHQLVTYMFLHADFSHLFFNMFSLWMFGRIIEQVFGSKRFLIYYMACGIGAGCCQEIWQFFSGDLAPTIGASGACYGILLAFGLTFPNQRILLLIPPIPVKAKWLVMGYMALELFLAFRSSGNVAHFAHVGGMLFGWLWMMHWKMWPRQYFSRWDPAGQTPQPGIFSRMKRKLESFFSSKPSMKVTGNSSHKDRTYGQNHRFGGNVPDPQTQQEQQERVNRILEKIKRSGYDSLTADEKRELFRNSHR